MCSRLTKNDYKRMGIMKTIKEQIEEKQKLVSKLEQEIIDLALNGKHFLAVPLFSVVGTWDCEKSPSGLCCYDHYKDLVHDRCVFCGQPEERK